MHRRQRRLLAGELGVEPAGVAGVLERGAEGWGDAFVEHVVPVDVAEERVGLDLFGVLGRAEAAGGVARQQLLQIDTESAGMCNGYSGLVLEDGVEDLVLVVAAERRLPSSIS